MLNPVQNAKCKSVTKRPYALIAAFRCIPASSVQFASPVGVTPDFPTVSVKSPSCAGAIFVSLFV